MKTTDVHVNAVRLGDHSPELGGEVQAIRTTAKRIYFTIRAEDGSTRTPYRAKGTRVQVAVRRPQPKPEQREFAAVRALLTF